jgi:uncharacterized protein (DUF58 family)
VTRVVSRKVSICRETLYYLLVLAFIIGGAILRNVNLLYLLAGMMIGPLLWNWRLVVIMLQRIDVTREIPRRVVAGESLYVAVTMHNRRRWLDSWALSVSDHIRPADLPGDGRTRLAQSAEDVSAQLYFPRVGVGESQDGSYRLRLAHRGRYLVGPLRISSRFPLGFIEASMTVSDEQPLIVCPRLGRLTRRWLQLIEAEQDGFVRSRRRNGPTEGDYYGLREWQSGDSKRWIHWRTSAKLGNLAVRQFERQANRDVTLVVDLWQPDEPQPQDLLFVELAVSFAATAVSDFCGRGPSQIQLAIAGATASRRSGKSCSAYQQELIDCLAVARGAPENDLFAVVDEALDHSPSDGGLVIITTRDLDFGVLRAGSDRRGGPFPSAQIVRVCHAELDRYFLLEPH